MSQVMSQVLVAPKVSATAQRIIDMSQDDQFIVGQYCPKFARSGELRKKNDVSPVQMDLKFVCRLSICEFSLEISEKGNIIGLLRVPPVHSIMQDGIFYRVLAARLRNTGFQIYVYPVDSHNGWGQISIKMDSALDAQWLREVCKERSFPLGYAYSELQKLVRARSVWLLQNMKSLDFRASEDQLPEELRIPVRDETPEQQSEQQNEVNPEKIAGETATPSAKEVAAAIAVEVAKINEQVGIETKQVEKIEGAHDIK